MRGILSGALRQKIGLKVESAKRGDGERVYSIPRYLCISLPSAITRGYRALAGNRERQRGSPLLIVVRIHAGEPLILVRKVSPR